MSRKTKSIMREHGITEKSICDKCGHIDCICIEEEPKLKLSDFDKKPKIEGKLSPEQIKNWRRVMFGMFGAYALIMPDVEVQRFRDKMQNDVDKL